MIIGLLGFIGSGKGTVGDILVDEHGFRKDSFASALKDVVAVLFGWPRHLLEGDTKESRDFREHIDRWWGERLGIERFTPRLALQLMGTDVLRRHFHDDIWVLTVERRLRDSAEKVVLTDCRFPNEVRIIQRSGGKAIRVDRGPEPYWEHVALKENTGRIEPIMARTFPDIHVSEWAWIGTPLDARIDNNGDLECLRKNVRQTLASLS